MFASQKASNPADIICAGRPDLKGKIGYGGMHGSNADFLAVHDEAGRLCEVFKIVSHGNSFIARRVRHEVAVLKHLDGKGTRVPGVTFSHDGDGYIIFGMTAVHGTGLSPDAVAALPKDRQEALAKSIGVELARIEKQFEGRPGEFKQSEYDGEKVDRTPYPQGLGESFARIHATGLSGPDKTFVENLLAAYDAKYKNDARDRRVLSHNDIGYFSGPNAFFDAGTGKISGIIDWEIAGFRKPEEGFREMWKTFKPDFVRTVLKSYSEARGEEVPVADVAAALLNQFITKGGYDPRRAARELREGFPELESFATGKADIPAMGKVMGVLGRVLGR